MTNTDELKTRVDALTKQLGQLSEGFSSAELKRKTERLHEQVANLRAENERISRDNETLRATLTNLVSSIEDSGLSDLLDSLQVAHREIDVVLQERERSGILGDLQSKGRLSVVEQRPEDAALKDEAATMAEKLNKGPYDSESRRFTQSPTRPSGDPDWLRPHDK